MNEGSDGADVTSGDSPFQTRAATTGKARSPTVVRRVGGTMSVDCSNPKLVDYHRTNLQKVFTGTDIKVMPLHQLQPLIRIFLAEE